MNSVRHYKTHHWFHVMVLQCLRLVRKILLHLSWLILITHTVYMHYIVMLLHTHTWQSNTHLRVKHTRLTVHTNEQLRRWQDVSMEAFWWNYIVLPTSMKMKRGKKRKDSYIWSDSTQRFDSESTQIADPFVNDTSLWGTSFLSVMSIKAQNR